MKSLLLLARVTFIYNICLLLAILLKYYDFTQDVDLKSTIIVSGYVLSLVFNLITFAILGLLILRKRLPAAVKPRWLFVANAMFFLVQLYIIFQ